jgi:hypothetical protein
MRKGRAPDRRTPLLDSLDRTRYGAVRIRLPVLRTPFDS